LGRSILVANDTNLLADGNRGAFRLADCLEEARHRGWDLGIDLVRDDFDDGLVFGHRIAFLFEPLADDPLGDRLAELRHDDCSRHVELL
jgi:hypothetical protein